MRIYDIRASIYARLKALPWRRYLTAMWILSSELQSMYADELNSLYPDWLRDDELSLASSTMDAVGEVAKGNDTQHVVDKATKLAHEWRQLVDWARDDVKVSFGLVGAWRTFESLAQEIGGLTVHYDAAEWVGGAGMERWRARPPRITTFEEEVDDASPMAQTLALFERIVIRVAEAPDSNLDPVQLRSKILN